MRRVALFLEDLAQESLIKAIVERVAKERSLDVDVSSRNARGGYGRVLSELGRFLGDLARRRSVGLPDLVVVATDANCKGVNERIKEVRSRIPDVFGDFVVCAIPDPHIERWMLLDSSAFKAVLGKGCRPPDQKCGRDRYKQLLIEAVREAGVTPLLGGMEHAESIVAEMDLEQAARNDTSLGRFLNELKARFARWETALASLPPRSI